MARDEHEMPVPSDESPLPWNESLGGIRASDGAWVLEDEFLCLDDLDFVIHAANNVKDLEDIVRRLAECYETGGSPHLIMIEAARLWAKMQKDAKGGNIDGE